MSQSPPPQNSISRHFSRFFHIVKRPKTIIMGTTSISILGLGYMGLGIFLREYLPPWLEQQVSQIINRPIDIGELQGFSLTHLSLGRSSIPTTPNHSSHLTTESVTVNFNPFSLLFQRTLSLTITPHKLKSYLPQNTQGNWLDLQITDETVPLNLDVTFALKKSQLQLLAYGSKNPVNVEITGQATYQENPLKKWDYNINLGLLASDINIQGKTIIKTTESQVKLTINKLALNDLDNLIPNLPIQLKQGDIKANINLNLPSLKEFDNTEAEGTLKVSNLESKGQFLKKPIAVLGNFSFVGNKVLIDKAQINLGNITGEIKGNYDWQTGSNLGLDIKGLSWDNLNQVFPISSPVKIKGQLDVNLKLTGKFNNPFLIGKIENKNPIIIDKTTLNKVNVGFQTNFDELVLKSFTIKPESGGEITAKGVIKTNLIASLQNKKPINLDNSPLNFTFQSKLNTSKIVDVYYELPEIINLGNLTAKGQLKGTLGNIKGMIQWQNLSNLSQPNSNILSQGTILINRNNLSLTNTELITSSGTISLTGNADLKVKTWQTTLNYNSLSLTPFCAITKLKCPDNFLIERGNSQFLGRLDKPFNTSLKMQSNLGLSIAQGKVIINSQIEQGKITTATTVVKLPVNSFLPQLPIPVTLNNSEINLTANLDNIWKNSRLNWQAITANGNLELGIIDSKIKTVGTLEKGNIKGVINLNNLSLNPLVSQLSIPVQVNQSKINFSGNLNQPNFNGLQINADTDLVVANKNITSNTQLNQGIITLNATATPLTLTEWIIKGYPVIKVKKANLNLTSDLASLLSLNFNSIKGNTQTEFSIGKGILITSTNFNQSEIKSQITIQNMDLSSFNSQLLPLDKFEPLNGKINLTVPINVILPSSEIFSVKADAISINIGKQNLTANGNLLLANLWTSPDIKEINLNLDTQVNLETLPLTKLLAKIPVNRNLLPQTIDLTGQGQFKGKLVAKNLLTDPLSLNNLQLIGDLSLSNFSINDRLFDPILTGKIKVESSEKIYINLRGKQDIIAANLTACTSPKCLFPYLLDSFEIQQFAKTSTPIIAQGKYESDRLVAKVQNFPLELLRISPISNYGIPDYLGGQLNINLEFQPSTLNLGGNLTLSNPKLGKIVGEQFKSSWVYQDNRVVLDNTTLKIGDSSYNLAGALNLTSGDIEGQLDVKEGYIQDILTALNVSDWDSLLRLLNLRDNKFTNAEQIKPKPIGNINDTVAEQLNNFWQNDRKIEDILAARNSGDLPRRLNIRGKFNGGITLGGNLKDPQLTVKLEGNKWQWTPQPSIPSIINPLGLVIEGAQIIPIEKIAIQGKLEDGIIKLKPTIEVAQTLAQGTLNLAYKNNKFYIEPSDFKVEQLTLDLVRGLIVIPEDINGIVRLEGVLQGSLINPEVRGKFEFIDGSIYARLLNQDLGGEFSYGQDKLKVKMTNPDFIQLNALVPFPINNNNNNDFKINAKIGTEAFSLLEPLTQGQIVWDGGKGEININLIGKVTVYDKLRISLNSDSKITLNLENGTFNSELLPIPVTLNSQIILQNGYFQVKELTAEVATRVLTAQGSLPLFPLPEKALPNKTPLTLTINEENISLDGIYQGLIDGKIVIDGALISPVIGGQLRFSQGKLTIPTFPKQQPNSPIFESWMGTFTPTSSIVSPPRLNNFKIAIDEIGIDQKKINPKFYFNVSGDVTLNGKLSTLSFAEIFALEPSGTVKVNTGQIDIPVTRVFFSNKQDNTLTFLPQDGLLNPYLNLELKFYLLLVGLQSIKDNEIPDDILQNSRARSAEVTLGIKGSASELLPNLGQQLEQVCQFTRTDNQPIPSSPNISNSLLTQITQCIEVNNLGTNSIGDLVQSPIVTITSNPPLTNSQLFALFGSQLPDFIIEKQQQNSTQLLEVGVPQVAVVVLPFLQDLIFQMNETTHEIGDNIGLPNLSIYPVLQTVYELDNKTLVRFSYNYSINEATIRYETKF